MPLAADRQFIPAWWVPGAHLQTLWGKLVRRPRRVPTRMERWRAPDGDDVEIQRLDARPGEIGAPRLLMLHGLEGTIRSHYLQAMLAEARRRGWAADVLIFRGCNGVVPRARRMYHSGETTDVDMVIRRLVRDHPGQPLLLLGFSLGANVLLKWLGERGTDLPDEVRAAAAVSTPFDLERGSRLIERGFARIYTRHFLKTLRLKALAKLAQDPGVFDVARLERAQNLYEFDDAVTAPLHGFADARDYYSRSSSINFLAGIKTATLLLSAYDDPFLPPEVLDDVLMMARNNDNLEVDFQRHGGHVGFVGGRVPWRPDYYIERRVSAFLSRHVASSTFASTPVAS